MNEIYRGKYEAHYSITVKGFSHDACLNTYNRFKSLVKALDWGEFSIKESKDARKGPVLKRYLFISYTAYSS